MKRTIITLALALISGAAFAQQAADSTSKNLNEVVIRGNRLDIPFNESSRNIQVITAKEIEQLPVHSVNELLAYVGGVDIQQRSPFGGQADISMDGGTSEQTLVLLNGIKLINAQTAHNMMNIPVPLDAIDHIEILHGAAARVYGINALTGAINIVTKKSSKSFVTANLQSGSSFAQKAEGDGSGLYGGGSLQLTANYGNDKQSQLFAFGRDQYNGQRYNSAQAASQFFYNGNYNFNMNNSVQALAGYVHNDFGANGFYAAPGDKNSEEIVETGIFSLSSKHKIGSVTLSPRISDRYDRDDYRYIKQQPAIGRSVHYTNALMLELNGSLPLGNGTLGFGWESRLGKINSSNIGKHQRNNHGAYAEYRKNLFGKLIANIGLYANYNTDFGWQAYPGLDLAYLVNEDWKISASAGSGQRIPSFTDLYLNQPPGNVGNPEVQPEGAWAYDANVRYHGHGLSVQTGAFYRDITDFIDWIRSNDSVPYSPVNFGENKIYGMYARMEQQFSLGRNRQFGYQVSYNYLNPKPLSANGDDQSKYVLETLKHQLIAGISYRYDNFSFHITNRYIKRMLNDAYDVLDARVDYRLRSFLIYADISNILNAQYHEAGAVPMPPRWFSLGVKFQWKEK
ncbi:MAG TPA: TonB-dependent receptor [Edaphocola sp.]|nr:TonB-dependent receptor [Edaphocola sp.]